VRRGDVLFQIDPVPYPLLVSARQAALALAQRNLEGSLSALDAADALASAAAHITFHAALEAYRHGVGSILTDSRGDRTAQGSERLQCRPVLGDDTRSGDGHTRHRFRMSLKPQTYELSQIRPVSDVKSTAPYLLQNRRPPPRSAS
jgi:hypothetical protein